MNKTTDPSTLKQNKALYTGIVYSKRQQECLLAILDNEWLSKSIDRPGLWTDGCNYFSASTVYALVDAQLCGIGTQLNHCDSYNEPFVSLTERGELFVAMLLRN